jgi:hypothetical protein
MLPKYSSHVSVPVLHQMSFPSRNRDLLLQNGPKLYSKLEMHKKSWFNVIIHLSSDGRQTELEDCRLCMKGGKHACSPCTSADDSIDSVNYLKIIGSESDLSPAEFNEEIEKIILRQCQRCIHG